MSQEFVLDCSLAMAWFFQGEATLATDALLDLLNQEGAVVVAQHWPLEVANTLLMGERRQRCTQADVAHFLNILGALHIEIDKSTGTNATRVTLDLARSQGLTIYDAAYLELAMRRQLPLASLDKALRSAATKVGVSCLPAAL
ncbi:MAG TPA: type II toxin-antitoxin system VapC family toxin [Candidatus Limnocylindria bacterium]|jgi:predicted nucleic acid-binding protein|nr:type II toxin-antitoxin system VapC family toxin [Candidatus Limnocylindria bacterium]